ncbi:MAG TPA: OmpA family protein [Vicinamibacterales bacterium]|nr:OmpA family protein [Vicinamibacterales bacterium]
MNSRAVGWRLSTDTVEQNADAVVFWPDPPRGPDESPRVDPDSVSGRELRRRQLLAEATTSFRGGRIRFAADSAMLMPDSDAPLAAVLAELRRDVELQLLVKAFADVSEVNGLELSLQRARLVVDWLAARGVAGARLAPLGCGAARALWFGRTEEERAANRRAELVRRSKWAACDPPSTFAFQ